MLREIIVEGVYVFWIVVIIGFGMARCCVYNIEATWDEWYQNYEYNLNPSEGSGWIDSVVLQQNKEMP